ncbi:uncharacterized protein BDV14DRAFT_179193 [Aspergillus stella-maris]|uniref:uncharacterized protein n=1 Tax=Aspergillus stella-maris TaxID=1810926 RepID=UPI003CCC9838
MFIHPLSSDAIPSILFRAERRSKTSFRDGSTCARQTMYTGPPTRYDFDSHKAWKRKSTRFRSFGTWGRAMQHRAHLQEKGISDVVVVAVWARGLMGVYSAEEAATKLGYNDMGLTGMDPDERRKIRHHWNEYLVEGGIAADEYRILAIFEGGGPDRVVDFEWPEYRLRSSMAIPRDFFPGRRSGNALVDIACEIYSYCGVWDDMKRDQLVKAMTRSPFLSMMRYS